MEVVGDDISRVHIFGLVFTLLFVAVSRPAGDTGEHCFVLPARVAPTGMQLARSDLLGLE